MLHISDYDDDDEDFTLWFTLCSLLVRLPPTKPRA